MSVDLSKEPDYDALIEKLIDLSLAGKLSWQETADENVFLAAVRGVQTFVISRGERKEKYIIAVGSHHMFRLTVQDQEGIRLFEHEADTPDFRNLFDLARRVGSRLDDKLDSTLQLLNGL